MQKIDPKLMLNISCGIIILSFFFYWISISYSVASAAVSAFDIVLGNGNMLLAGFSGIIRFILFLCPLTAGFILYYNLKKQGIYPVNRKVLFSIPLVATRIFYISLSAKVSDIKQMSMGFGNGISVTGLLGAGFYIVQTTFNRQ